MTFAALGNQMSAMIISDDDERIFFASPGEHVAQLRKSQRLFVARMIEMGLAQATR